MTEAAPLARLLSGEDSRNEIERLRKLLGAVAWECNPNDCEWSDPVSARAHLWSITYPFVQFREDD